MLSRFLRYVDKVFDFGHQVQTMVDRRVRSVIPASAVWFSGFLMFATRRGSLNGLQADLRVPGRMDGLIGSDPPSSDTLGRVFGLIDPDDLRKRLSEINHRLGRNKALKSEWSLRFVAVDGHEFFSQSIPSLSRLWRAEDPRQ